MRWRKDAAIVGSFSTASNVIVTHQQWEGAHSGMKTAL
jgi:hypothetical protein